MTRCVDSIGMVLVVSSAVFLSNSNIYRKNLCFDFGISLSFKAR